MIILRVANRRALTSNSIPDGSVDSIRFRSQGTTDSDGSFPGGLPTNTTEVNGEVPGELGPGVESATEEVSLSRWGIKGPP